jgi:hypothetical protein
MPRLHYEPRLDGVNLLIDECWILILAEGREPAMPLVASFVLFQEGFDGLSLAAARRRRGPLMKL